MKIVRNEPAAETTPRPHFLAIVIRFVVVVTIIMLLMALAWSHDLTV